MKSLFVRYVEKRRENNISKRASHNVSVCVCVLFIFMQNKVQWIKTAKTRSCGHG